MKLKWAFYEWIGTLSVDEVMVNEKLIECVKRLERLMIHANNNFKHV